jgi:hypothetical protein
MSSDIQKGEAWFQAITEELADSKIGVAFITNENHSSPWLHFESGAMLTKLQTQRICPVVVDLAKTDYDGPLKNLQLTHLGDKADFFKLLMTINGACDHPLDAEVLRDTFELRWPSLEKQVGIAQAASKTAIPEAPKIQRSPEDKIDEILGLLREIRADSPSYRRKPSNEDVNNLAELNWQILTLSDGTRDWTAERVAEYIAENGDVVNDRGTMEELGKLADLKEDSTGRTWVRIRTNSGKLVAKPIDSVSITPF